MQTIKPSAVVSDGFWSGVGAALPQAVADGNDATYATAATTIGTTELLLRLATAQTPIAGPRTLNVRCADPFGYNPGGACAVRVYQGSTLLSTTVIPGPLGAMAGHDIDVSNLVISDWSDVRVGFTAAGSWDVSNGQRPSLRIGDTTLFLPDPAVPPNNLGAYNPAKWAGLPRGNVPD